MTRPDSSAKRWLAIHFYGLALDLLRQSGFEQKTPRVILDGPQNRRVVAFGNAAAQALGVHTGHALIQAQSFAPQLVSHLRDVEQEQATLARLAQWAYGFSSQVAICTHASASGTASSAAQRSPNHTLLPGENMLLLEIAASAQLFGKQLLDTLRLALADFGFSARFGSGVSDAAARCAARVLAPIGHAGKSNAVLYPHRRFERYSDALPLALTEFAPATLETLSACGIESFGALIALPRPELAQRFGMQLLHQLDQLSGATPSRLTLYAPPLSFSASVTLPAPLDATQMLLFPLRRLLHQLSIVLRGHDRAVLSVTLILTLEKRRDAPATHAISLALAQPSRSTEHLFELLKARLDSLQMAAPALVLTLNADRWVEFAPAETDLLDSKRGALAEFSMVLERLRARLGNAALVQLHAAPDYRPERANQLSAWANGSGAARGALPQAPTNHSQIGPRPLWLLAAPQAIARADFELLSGPERLESGWWDDADMRRDYFQAREHSGKYLWVFQNLSDAEPKPWFVHGFDLALRQKRAKI